MGTSVRQGLARNVADAKRFAGAVWERVFSSGRDDEARERAEAATLEIWLALLGSFSGRPKSEFYLNRDGEEVLEWYAMGDYSFTRPESPLFWEVLVAGEMPFDVAAGCAAEVFAIYDTAARRYREQGGKFPDLPPAVFSKLGLWRPYFSWLARCRRLCGADLMLDAYCSGVPVEAVLGDDISYYEVLFR